MNAENKVVDAAPSFATTSRVRIANPGLYRDDEHPFSSVASVDVLENGEMLYPMLTGLENVQELLDNSASNFERLAVTGFAEDVRVWEGEDAYYAQADDVTPMASTSFVPSGMFAPQAEDVAARGMITGIVEEAEIRHNQVTGNDFVRALLRTYGMSVESVFAPVDVPSGLVPGNIVQGEFWLMGRLLSA